LYRHVEAADRLVADDQLRLERERPGDSDALSLSARQLVRFPGRGTGAEAADEYTSFDAIAAGADVLLAALLELARGDRP
jgi:hypothetical protein